MKISSRVNLDGIERLLDSHFQMPRATLEVPSVLMFGGALGLDASLLLAVATWARSDMARELRVRVLSEHLESHLESLTKTLYGTAAVYFSDKLKDIQGMPIGRRQALSYATNMVDAMYKAKYSSIVRGQTINLFCLRGAEREFVQGLYEMEMDGGVRSRKDFRSLLSDLLETCAPGRKYNSIRSKMADPMGELAYELFKNTDDHALVDPLGNMYQKHLRGLTVRLRSINKNDIPKITGNSTGASPYFGKRLLSNAGRATLSFFEMSVYDTGPGLARRWLSHEREEPCIDLDTVSLSDEINAVTKCFLKNSTTKNSASSGQGLDLVTSLLWRHSGFLRVRTGRLCLFQSFDSNKANEGFAPQPWHGKRQLQAVQGTAFTVCIPFAEVA